MGVEFEAYLRAFDREADALSAVARGGLERDVPSCPGWTVRTLVDHVAQVYEHKIACTELLAEPDPWPPEWPADRDSVAWMDDARRRLISLLRERGPAAPSKTWWEPDQTVGFWARRMAHETAIHRVDAELAFGSPTPVEPGLATDGVDEVLEVVLSGDWSEAPRDELTGRRVAVETGGRRWLVRLDRTWVGFSRDGEADAPDLTVSGDPSGVLLWLWGRGGAVETSGDQEVVGLLLDRLKLATQ